MLVGFVKKIRKLGFQCVEDKAGATLAAIHNSGLFAGGHTLIGSYTYGVLLNSLGIVARSSLTENIDLARLRPLHLAGGSVSMLETLRSSGLPFMEVSTELNHRSKNKTMKLPGADRLMVDILVSGNSAGRAVNVPEIQVYAQEIPLLHYLASNNMAGVVLSKNYVIPVFVPQPSRFALHKLFSSQSRTNQLSKSEKDLWQAATIIAAIEEAYLGDIWEKMLQFPKNLIRICAAIMLETPDERIASL
ncbi:MAG: hypothetical protein ACI8WM_003306 [Burkholderiaceae bacterium]|jgi:hypothetical protein